MKLYAVFGMLAFGSLVYAQVPAIHSGSTVYIEPNDGYEIYLAAAIQKKKVPVVVVTDREKADFIIQTKMTHASLNNPAPVVVVNNSINTQPQTPASTVQQSMQQGYEEGRARMNALGETDASMAVIDAKSSQIVFATSAEQRGAADQREKTAERCMARLKESIEKSEKPKK